jgi:hypothetical protein
MPTNSKGALATISQQRLDQFQDMVLLSVIFLSSKGASTGFPIQAPLLF